MELSKRLQAVADLVTEGASVADIGTDHGYIPIYLIEHHIAEKVIALDINRGPLERARMHIVGHGLKEKIETRLSDGLEKSPSGRSGYDDCCRHGRRSGDKNPDGRKNGSRCAGYNDPAATVGDWKSQTIFE